MQNYHILGSTYFYTLPKITKFQLHLKSTLGASFGHRLATYIYPQNEICINSIYLMLILNNETVQTNLIKWLGYGKW